MRMARLADYKRRLRELAGSWPVRVTSFSFNEIPTLGSGELIFALPLTVLAGPNGVGKTTLLRALWATAALAQADPEPPIRLKLSSGAAELCFCAGETNSRARVTFASGEVQGEEGSQRIDVDIIHVDTSTIVKELQIEFCNFNSVEDLINGVGGKTVDEGTLAELNYICRRDYREVKVYELERGEGVAPFFEVSYENDRYDSRTMGAGELSILYLWWAIERAPQSAIVLLEEPETYLSAGSQEAFLHFLIAATVEKRLNTILTSHSPKIIENVSDEQLIFLFRRDGSVKTKIGVVPPALLETMGIQMQVASVVLVEDTAAEIFLRRLLERNRPGLSRRIEISSRDGEGNIIALLKKLGGQLNNIKIVGMFDGDMRGKIPEEIEQLSGFLPGDKAIEKTFRDLLKADSSPLKKATGVEDLEMILFGLEGKDHHDWYEGLCAQLGLTKAQLFPIMFNIWEGQANSADAAKDMVEKLSQLLSRMG